MTIFSKIIAGEIPSYKCAENEEFYAFLDISPVAQGHTLVVPKREEDYLFDLTDEELARMAVLGLEVAHAHIHLIPLQSEGDMDFHKEKLKLPAEEMALTAAKILEAFNR